jgi:hypothetical protein
MTRSPDRSLFLTGPGLRPKPGLGTLTATRTSLRPASHGLAFLTAPGTSLGYCNVGHFPPLARQREGEGAGEREKGREGGREGEGEGERERETGSGWPRLGSAPRGSHTARPALHTANTLQISSAPLCKVPPSLPPWRCPASHTVRPSQPGTRAALRPPSVGRPAPALHLPRKSHYTQAYRLAL